MPTGYTHPVQTGAVTDLREFALQCARAFVACITMRDDPMDAPIPERFEPSDYHKKALVEALGRLAWLNSLTAEQCEYQAFIDHEDAMRAYNEREKTRWVERDRYESMLAKVGSWACPAECSGLRDFMIKQLLESIDFDCHPCREAPDRLTGETWIAMRRKSAEWDVSYHTKEHASEIARTEERNRWLAALRSSL